MPPRSLESTGRSICAPLGLSLTRRRSSQELTRGAWRAWIDPSTQVKIGIQEAMHQHERFLYAEEIDALGG